MKKVLVSIIGFMMASVSFGATKITLSERNTVVLRDDVMPDSMAVLAEKIKALDDKLPASEPIYLVLDSGGGSITAGLEFIDNIQAMKRPVHTITQFAASMAFQIAEALGTRYILKEGTLMSHHARGGFYGEFPNGNLDKRFEFWKRKLDRIDEQVVARTKGKYTLETYKAAYENEYWCDGEDCIKAGFADEIVEAECADDFVGRTEVVTKNLFFSSEGLLAIEFIDTKAKCPLVSGIIDWNIRINGDEIFVDPKTKQGYGAQGAIYNFSPEIKEKIEQRYSPKEKFDRVYSPKLNTPVQKVEPKVDVMLMLQQIQKENNK